MIGFLTPYANSGIGFSFGFVFFGTNLAAAIIVYFFLYEPKGLSLESVDAMYSQRDLKAWQSHKWIPEGYIDRKTRDLTYWNRRPSVLQDERHHPGGDGVLAQEHDEKSVINNKGDDSPASKSEDIRGGVNGTDRRV